MKILISGISGIGKTTLAKHISEQYKIPFVIGSSKILWPKFKINTHQELINKCSTSPRFALDFQYELLEYREKEMANNQTFVTDRSPLDNLAYFLLQISHNCSQLQTSDYIEACRKSFPVNYTQLYLDFNKDVLAQMGEVEDDGARIINNYYQLTVASVFDNIIDNNLLDLKHLKRLKVWDFETRVTEVDELIFKNYGGKGNSLHSLF